MRAIAPSKEHSGLELGIILVTGKKAEQYSQKETQDRFEAALRRGMNTPHKPLKEKPKVKKVAKKSKPKKVPK